MPTRFASPAYGFLLWELTRTEFKLRDQGTVLGFLWTLLHPALMFVVMYALFIKWLGQFVDQYAAYLIIGLVQWQFFEKATSQGLVSLRNKAQLIRNFDFARELIVLSAVGSVFLSYLLELVVLLAFLMLVGVRPTASWIFLPALVAVHLIFTLGVALCLALLTTEFEDLGRIWTVLMTAGFYLTPVFYPLLLIAEDYQKVMALNPLLQVLGAFRGCLLSAQPWSPFGLALVLLSGLALTAGALCVFRYRSLWIADRVLSH